MKNIFLTFLTCICASPWASAEFFSGGYKRRFAYPFQVAEDVTQIDVHKTLYLFCAIKKISNVTEQLQTVFPLRKLHWANVCFSEHKYLNS